jgi:hypothetical protein
MYSRRLVLLFALALALATPAASAQIHVAAGLTTGANDGSSWADAFQGALGLQNALAVSMPGDVVFVAQGTYEPTDTGDRTAVIRMRSGVEIYGGFLGTESSPDERPPFGTALSILSGDLNGDDGGGLFGDNSFHVLNGNGTSANAILDGFVVTGGNADTAGANRDRGAGILCINLSSPTIRNCHFVANRCLFGGGAGYINGPAPAFVACTFEDNDGGSFGGAFDIATGGAVRFDRCLFIGNTADRAGALEIFSTTGVVVANSVFRGNVATGSSGGGAVWLGSGGSTQFRNCTVVANSATSQAVGGLRNQGATVGVANCIFWDNQGSGGAQGAANQIAGTGATYSIVEGGLAGTGNLALDPQFVDLAAGDYALTLASPAIDAGDNASVPAGVTVDFAGNPRFADVPTVADTGAGAPPLVDIGAFEYQAELGAAYCFGDGSGSPCPCGNSSGPGEGCATTTGSGMTLSVTGTASIANDDLTLVADGVPLGNTGLFYAGQSLFAGNALFDGLQCAGGNALRFQARLATTPTVTDTGLVAQDVFGFFWTPGATYGFQYYSRDNQAGPSPCGGLANLSNGVSVTMTP